MKKEDKTPRDKNNRPHGLWEQYYANNNLYYRGSYIHGEKHGLWEFYYSNDGQLTLKKYYIK